MSTWRSTLGQRIARLRGPRQEAGVGAQSQRLAQTQPLVYNDFSGGLNRARTDTTTPPNSSPDLVNFRIDERGRLITWNGLELVETFAGGRQPVAMFVHGNSTTGGTELVFIAGSELGWRNAVDLGTTWTNVALPAGGTWVACKHGDALVLSNGVGATYTRLLSDSAVSNAGWGPARALMSFAGRVFGGAVTESSVYEPLGVFWTGASSEPNDMGLGSGFEILYDDQQGGDYIVALRALTFNTAAIFTRRATWLATATGVANRPADFSPRDSARGAVNAATVVRYSNGAFFLSDEGVMLFDGNSVTPVSAQINDELLPLDFSRINQYSASYNPLSGEYVLHTPSETYYFKVAANRWLKRSLVALRSGSVFVGAVGGGTSPTEGGWSRDWNQSWGTSTQSMSLSGGGNPGYDQRSDLFYLQSGRLLRESNTATIDGAPVIASWSSPELDVPNELDGTYTIESVSIRYRGGGEIQILVRNVNGVWQVFKQSAQLANSVEPRTLDFVGQKTSQTAAVRIVQLNGMLTIEGIAIRATPRSSRRWL